jgi:hypothetical protein
VDRLKHSLELMRFQVETGGVLCLWHDDIVERRGECVQAIATYLQLALAPDAVADVAERLSRDNVRRMIKGQAKSGVQVPGGGVMWDDDTLFNDRHVSDSPVDPTQVFSAAQIAAIAKRLSDFVDPAAALHPSIRQLGGLTDDDLLPVGWPSGPQVDAMVEAPIAPSTDASLEPDDADATTADAGAVTEAAAPETTPAVTPDAAPVAASSPATTAAPSKPAPVIGYDLRAQAVRRALARDLLRSLSATARAAAKGRSPH